VRGSFGVPKSFRVINTFSNRNQPPDLDLLKGFYSFFPFPRIKIESSKIEGSRPIKGLIPENREHNYVRCLKYWNTDIILIICWNYNHNVCHIMLEMLALNKQCYLHGFYRINPGGVTPEFIPLLTGNNFNWRGYRTPLVVVWSSLRIVPIPTGGNLSYPSGGIARATT